MAKQNNIPEVDIVVDEQKGVIREVQPEKKLRSKKGHEMRVNASIYAILIAMSIIWLCPFIFLVLQSFRSYATEAGGCYGHPGLRGLRGDQPGRLQSDPVGQE